MAPDVRPALASLFRERTGTSASDAQVWLSGRARTNLSDFVRRKAIEAAEAEILARRIITIPAKDWERFEAWAAAPAQQVPGLAELGQRPPTWRT